MERVSRDPDLLEHTRARVAAWHRDGSVAKPYVEAWERLLDLPLPELTARVLEPSEAGHDLRQVSPFAGVLSPRERWQILRGARSAVELATR